ncbi:uncharacterized protein Z518_01363 [Rhinocladiella mackenziei CBS 650.93]|uniref:NB-ARC domain-containing protein n=1 Tax=Rhinocladiella mackenziei CBS 650.93 TaxID=1442369 RepID=A0A0D2J3H5_9EURO|nr:uncharacterized protein Z518_01363 [Rhinocladiella mackenziei CBS 650.93]KIX10281.1 hypothetical protein Z518_01363 [Rhinocladiella mackenziei CBS 650.93]
MASIYKRADDCLNQFKLLVKIENEVREAGKTEAQDLGFGELRADEQLARFEMWASNIGVFADGHASLDYRVRDRDDAKQLMIEFLGTLGDFIHRGSNNKAEIVGSSLISIVSKATESLSPNQMQSQDAGAFPSGDGPEQSLSSLSSPFQGTESDSLAAALPPTNLGLFEQRLQVIERTIDRLYRLSKLIRQPSILSHNPKAENFPITDDEDNNIDEQFRKFAVECVAHKFPDVSKELKERLGNGIVTRRKRFLYRQKHQRKLSTRTIMADSKQEQQKGPVPKGDGQSTIRGTRAVLESSNQAMKGPKGTLGGAALPSQTSASGMARTSIHIDMTENDEESNQSTTFTNTPVDPGGTTTFIPDPPKPTPGSKEFECPYCCIILPISYAKASKWRRHVMRDLEPYACVFEKCPDHNLFFRDRSSWIAHMRNTHTTRWVCTSGPHSPCQFRTDQEYEDHMWEAHAGTFTKSQLPLLKKRSRIPSSTTFRACPLCRWRPSEDELRSHLSNLTQDEPPSFDIDKMASERITKHLASHLELLSVRALPWPESPGDESDESVESKHAQEGTDQTEDDSSAIYRAQLVSSSQTSQIHDDEHGSDDSSIVIVDEDSEKNSSTAESYAETWDFIPHPAYYGHDRDPVLQPLLRKWYFDIAPSADAVSVNLPAYIVPVDRDKNFHARTQALKTIRQSLCPDPHVEGSNVKPTSFPRCFAVHGPGGMGKTQVAAQFVTSHRHTFDAVLWVYAENTYKILQDFNSIAIGLGLISEDHIDAKDLYFTRDLVKRWLVNPLKHLDENESPGLERASWLLVFDGVEDGEVLNEFWPYDGPGSILITSRNPHSWSTSLELRPWNVNEATEFLLRITGREVSDEERASAVTIARRLGGLPLALAQMGGIIAHKSMSFGQFLRLYDEKESQQELLQWFVDSARPRPSNYEHNVASVWAFDSLGKGTNLLSVLSMLDPDGIPENLFLDKPAESDHPDLVELKRDYKTAKNELLARSLMTESKREKKIFVHRLVQDVSRTRMTTSEMRSVFLTCVRLISSKWPFESLGWRHGIARWEKCDELFPHVQRLKDLFPEVATSIDSFEDYEFARLLIDAGWYRHERGSPTDAVQFNNVAQGICESMKLRILEDPECASDEPGILSQLNYSLNEIHHNRGCIDLETNDPVNALKYLKLFNEKMIKELGRKPSRNDMRLAISWNELGNAYMLNRNWPKGEECFLKSIEEMKQLRDFQPTMISLPLANLGLAYWLQGKLEDAVETLTKGLEDRQKALGLDDRDSFITGRFFHALGNVRGSQGNQDEALSYHRRTVEHYKITLGNRHHRTADAFVKVADHNIRMHQYEMAEALLNHALEAYSSSNHFLPEKARASFKRAEALRGLGRDEEADLEVSKCFKIYTLLFRELIRSKVANAEYRKTQESELTSKDVTSFIAFWSR